MRIVKFVQTPFITHDDKNKITISVADWDFCNPYGVEISINGDTVYSQKVFAAEFSANIPECREACECLVKITPFEDLPVQKAFTLTPSKHWEIPLLYSSHEDLGYCAYIDKLHYECYEYLKVAMKLCREHQDYKYVIEHYWWLDAFDTYATDDEKEELKQLFSDKRIDLNAIHSGIHTSWGNAEELVRSMYFGCRNAKEKYGIEPKTVFFTDLSGMNWSAVSAFTSMGIKYAAIFSNRDRNCPENTKIPPVFWWTDKSKNNRLLFWHQRSYRPYGLSDIWCDTLRQYPEGGFTFDDTKALKTEKWFTEKINSMEKSDYDILPICFYDDRELPTTMLLTVCGEMNKRWKYPRFKMEIPSVFFKDIEEKYGKTLPELSGDITDQWADYATIAPQLMSKRRKISRMLYDTEMLSCINGIKENTTYKSDVFSKAYWNLSCFDEHCWATSSKHPQKMHRYNIDKVKREPIEQSFSGLKAVFNTMCDDSKAEKMNITNLIPQGFEGSLRLDAKALVPAILKHQILPDNTVITSTLSFDCAEARCFDAAEAQNASEEIFTDFIETNFYKVRLDILSKKIISITEKQTDRELLDTDSPFELGQFIYTYSQGKTTPFSGYEIPKTIELRIYSGDVAYVIVQKGYEEQSGAETLTQVIFYKNEKNIDIDVSYKNASGMIGDFYDRYKKNYFFALPFKTEHPQFYTELPAGDKNEQTEAIPMNTSDYAIVQNWIAAENENGGIAVYTEDMPGFHIGRIKYNHFEGEFHEDKAHLYLYASSNRSNNLIYETIDQCHAEYRLSVLPYTGKRCDTVPAWSNRKSHTPFISSSKSQNVWYLKIKQDNVRLVSMKKAEDNSNAVVLRFVETSGKKTDCSAKLFFIPKRAVYATNHENDLKEIKTEYDTVFFEAQPYSYVTLKIYGDFELKNQ